MKKLNKVPRFSPKEEEALRQFKSILRERLKGNFLFIKLFGSRAIGKHSRGSDIDIIVVVKHKNMAVDLAVAEAETNIFSYKYNIRVHCLLEPLSRFLRYTREEWPFYLNIEREGILI